MNDAIERLGASTVQHGKYNDRIYVMKLVKADVPDIIEKLDALALSKGYSKIFAKVPASAGDAFKENGYVVEAHIPGFFSGIEDAYFMGKYLSDQRQRSGKKEQLAEIIELATSKSPGKPAGDLPPGYSYRKMNELDAARMTYVYRQVFRTYPFPIHKPEYLSRTMQENVVYFGICRNDGIVALASCEMDIKSRNVEMTDIATLPGHRGNGFAAYLLWRMEKEMRERKMRMAYTIARATSPGINIAFARMGYRHGGILINNTNISGSLESMNVWYKLL